MRVVEKRIFYYLRKNLKEMTMINFENESLSVTIKKTFLKVRGLKKRTKELIGIGVTVMMLGSFVLYDAAAGVAFAASAQEGTPYAIVAGDEEIAVLQSKSDAEMVVENVKAKYGKDNSTETAMITPAVSVVEKEYVTAEDVDVKTIAEATEDILAQNSTSDPYFTVTVKQPVVKSVEVAYETKVVEDSDLEKGKEKVVTEGKAGSKLITGESTIVNGKTVSTEVYTEEKVSDPVTKVVKKGTKEEEPGTVQSTGNSSSSTSSSSKSYKKVRYNASTSNGVVGYAQAFHGVPYVYGGSTPSGFDCSGFTAYVYRAFGVYLPHSSGAQAGYGTPVSASQAKPGDLVVMPGHVGIYAGNGYIVHAPAPGQSVKTQKIWTGCSFRRLV